MGPTEFFGLLGVPALTYWVSTQLGEAQSALFVSESQALQALAAVAGATAAAPALERQGRAMAALVNGSLWDEARLR